ncbi:PLP-dependent aminotransferase family protein [Chryseobacterium carnipullorum]|uniref:HTH-type transcriptional regulator norG n=1 Tax=Chryseobacterium carnipullorum TaxID=1124835 RepID=A0A376DUV0_CHRCU|nr:PLP-dependent aminotransferase family protein [Chryseobacterium carnipullorum]AZA49886.1 PLP-dependent aminotransferase family protein [Chryseobacterium carnipullorum]AZA64774.1 PLP-dependent aminotransferase family protein [Chryseobacterium carnipullorum]STC96114.1 HTH-type transcriptional regulator norG [Chryseobacterium carnipullorum]
MFPFEHVIIIDKEHGTPLYRQIAVSIINAIRTGVLQPGAHLPGTRELSRTLGIHRKTVVAAYDELYAQDWITIVPRKYTAVSDHIPFLKPQKWNTASVLPSYENSFKLPFRTIDEKKEKSGISVIPELVIDDGHPDVRISPIDELLKTYRSYTSKRHTIKNANMGTEQGTLRLREELAQYLSETRGLNIGAENVLITHGAQMSIYLTAQLLLSPQSTVIVGIPNYPAANAAFEQTGATVLEVPVDENGMDIKAVERICRTKKIDAVYVIPHHHYPTTVTLSAGRRMELLELSNTFSFAIIEDDYDYDYHYTSSPYLPLASGSHNGNIIYTGSFSKILDPSLRIGFMVAPGNFIEQCTALRKIIDVGGDGYMQNALAFLIKEGELKRHLKKAKKIYHQRRNFLDVLLKDRLNPYISYVLPPGGMALWITLRPEYPVSHLINLPQLKILRADEELNAFRFGFASMDEKELETTVDFLQKTLSSI